MYANHAAQVGEKTAVCLLSDKLLVVPIAKKLRFLFLSMRECNPMSKTLEAVIFCVCVPFALFNDGMYASKFDRSQGDTVLLA